MRARSLFVGLLTLACSTVLLAASPQDEEEEHSELEEHMELIEGAVKSLRRSLRDPEKREQSLELISQLQAATVTSKALIPRMVESLPEAERAAFLTGYREMMVDFLDHQLDLERALLAGDVEAAKAAFKPVHDMEDEGHERFTEDEE